MNLENAPRPDDEEDRECSICDSENSFVLYEGERVCKECGYAPTAGGTAVSTQNTSEEWDDWFEHRDEQYSGFHGTDRIKFVGGFASAYDFGADFE